jgi:exodeoxyribonuclease-3
VKIATWNVNSLRPRLEHLTRWVQTAQPDVLCLQETKVTDDLFPHEELAALGFPHRAIWGQKTYNGVAILSKLPLDDVRVGFAGPPVEADGEPQARLISAVVGGARVVNVYVPNGSEPGSDKYAYKLAWLARFTDELPAHAAPDDQLLVCGDFNIAPGDADTYDPFATADQILVSPPERAALAAVLKLGLVDSWRKKSPFATEYSWWAYQAGGFKKNHGFRIDHILLSQALMRRCRSVTIDREPRRWEKPSDHAPVVAAFLA